jgi:hypothetical protein
MRMTVLDRALLVLAGLLAAYQIAIGVDGLADLPIMAYTIAFGVLLVAGLLLIILGFEALDSPIVVVVSTVIPLSLALGLVWEHLPAHRSACLAFVLLGFAAVLVTRLVPMKNRLPVFTLVVVHAAAGLAITLLPIVFALSGRAPLGFALVGVGGALISLGGLLLSFLKAGRPLLSRTTIFRMLPGLLLLTTAAFVAGFQFG